MYKKLNNKYGGFISEMTDNIREKYKEIQNIYFNIPPDSFNKQIIIHEREGRRLEPWLSKWHEHHFWFYDDWRPTSAKLGTEIILTGFHHEDDFSRRPFTFIMTITSDEYFGPEGIEGYRELHGVTEYQGLLWHVKVITDKRMPYSDMFILTEYAHLEQYNLYPKSLCDKEAVFPPNFKIPYFTYFRSMPMNAIFQFNE